MQILEVVALIVILSIAAGHENDVDGPAKLAPPLDQAAPSASFQVEEITLQLAREEPFHVERGWLTVSENRGDPASSTIEVGFYRLETTAQVPATPIFVLPGGPGSSWITEIERAAAGKDEAFARRRLLFQQHFFEDLRSVADVVIVDQRGAGISRPRLSCNDRSRIPNDTPVSAQSYQDAARGFVGACLEQLRAAGRDVRGYTIFELVEDVNSLRTALGYDRITLFAGSFGSQWGLSFIKLHEEHVSRFVFWGLEGLDHAYDDPGGVLDALTAIYNDTSAAGPAGAGTQPGFRDLLEDTLAELQRSPSSVAAPTDGGVNASPLHFGPIELQRSLFGTGDFNVRDRLTIASWYSYVSELLAGDYTRAHGILLDLKQINHPNAPVPQLLSIDCGLSVSEDRRVGLELDPAGRLLGNINLPYDILCAQWPTIDVGNEFRRPKISKVRGLLIHGTWDVSTPFDNAVEVARLFPEADLVPVRRATHRVLRELYRERGPEFRPLLRDFLSGRPVDPPSMIELPGIRIDRPTRD